METKGVRVTPIGVVSNSDRVYSKCPMCNVHIENDQGYCDKCGINFFWEEYNASN